jgi:oligo-1,6-glucosidase
VAAQENNPDSALNYFRKMVQLRKREKTLVYGKYTLLDADNQEVYVYLRSDEQNKILVLLNFSSHQASANLSFDLSKAEVLIDNYPGWQGMKLFTLRPYEARLIKL